jgi:hypothetical protein
MSVKAPSFLREFFMMLSCFLFWFSVKQCRTLGIPAALSNQISNFF